MGLAEWTRLEGGQTEGVVAMLVNREHPNSVRITPSRGDGGVDILDRRAGPLGTDHVYQVKRYTAEDQASGDSLDARQKAEVENSLKALTTDPRWKGVNHPAIPAGPPESVAVVESPDLPRSVRGSADERGHSVTPERACSDPWAGAH